jgi:hypothetical protein
MLTAADMPPGYVLVVSAPDHVKVIDAVDADLFIDGTIDADGELEIEIRTERESDGSKSVVRGKVLYDLMMRHFGAAVKSVAGYWMYGTNLAEFNRLTGLGYSEKQAATGTWAGIQAGRYGFVNATRRQTIGGAGYYGLASFVFTR